MVFWILNVAIVPFQSFWEQFSYRHCSECACAHSPICVLLPRHDISMAFKFGELLDATVLLYNHFRKVLMEAVLTDTCNARRAPCVLLNLPLRLAAVSWTLQRTSETENNKQLQLSVCKSSITKITSQWRHCLVKLVLIFVKINEK